MTLDIINPTSSEVPVTPVTIEDTFRIQKEILALASQAERDLINDAVKSALSPSNTSQHAHAPVSQTQHQPDFVDASTHTPHTSKGKNKKVVSQLTVTFTSNIFEKGITPISVRPKLP